MWPASNAIKRFTFIFSPTCTIKTSQGGLAQKKNKLLVFKALLRLLHTPGKSYVAENYPPVWTNSPQAFTLTDLSRHVGMIPAVLYEQQFFILDLSCPRGFLLS